MSRMYSVLLRVYTPKPKEVAERVDRAMEHAQHFLKVREQFPALSRLVFLVPDDYDCGRTHRALFARLSAKGLLFQNVALYGPPGHHSREVLNFGIGVAREASSHALIVSGKAMSYLTVPAMRAIDEAFANGAKVTGLGVDELKELVLIGRIQNTFAAWDIDALNQVGGFDSSTGVEEIVPIIRLFRKYGPCIAPLDPAPGTLDIVKTETGRARHKEVMSTKIHRQMAELERVVACIGEETSGIMPGYPRPI